MIRSEVARSLPSHPQDLVNILLQRGSKEIMFEPPDSLNTPVEESGEPIPPPVPPMMNPTIDCTPERRSLLDRLLKRRSDGGFVSRGWTVM